MYAGVARFSALRIMAVHLLLGAGLVAIVAASTAAASTPTTLVGGVSIGQLSQTGLQFIANNEGYRDHPYNDLAKHGNCTIGYGHLLHYGSCTAADYAAYPQPINPAQGLAWLQQDVQKAVNAVNANVSAPLSQDQFDTLVDFAYNVGSTAFAKSTLVKLLNQGQYNQVGRQLARWVHSGGKVVKGLVNRRAAEARMFGNTGPQSTAQCVVHCSLLDQPSTTTTTSSTDGSPSTTSSTTSPTTYTVTVHIDDRQTTTPDGRSLGQGIGQVMMGVRQVTYTCADGQECGQAQIPAGTPIILTPTWDDTSTFVGWSGTACSAQDNPCTFTINSNVDLTANFGVSVFSLTVTNNDPSEGEVLSPDAGIACGEGQTNCDEQERSNVPIGMGFSGAPNPPNSNFNVSSIDGCTVSSALPTPDGDCTLDTSMNTTVTASWQAAA